MKRRPSRTRWGVGVWKRCLMWALAAGSVGYRWNMVRRELPTVDEERGGATGGTARKDAIEGLLGGGGTCASPCARRAGCGLLGLRIGEAKTEVLGVGRRLGRCPRRGMWWTGLAAALPGCGWVHAGLRAGVPSTVEAGDCGAVGLRAANIGAGGGYRGMRVGEAGTLGPYTEGGASSSAGAWVQLGHGRWATDGDARAMGQRLRNSERSAFDHADDEDPFKVWEAELERGGQEGGGVAEAHRREGEGDTPGSGAVVGEHRRGPDHEERDMWILACDGIGGGHEHGQCR